MTRAKDGGAGRLRAVVLCAALLALGLEGTALAAPPVTNPNDSGPGSLRAALAGANSGDTIAVPAGTYLLTSGQLDVVDDVVIDGAGAGSTVIDANGTSRVFNVSLPCSACGATIRDVTITGGRPQNYTEGGGGGIRHAATSTGSLTVLNSTITANAAVAEDNSTNHGGAGIRNEASGGLTVSDSTITDNSVTEYSGQGSGGAGIYNNLGSLVVTRSTLSDNTIGETGDAAGSGSTGGAAIYHRGSTLTVSDSTMAGNQVVLLTGSGLANGGGGIYAAGSGSLTVTNSTVSANRATVPSGPTSGGGGIFSGAGGGSSLRNLTIAGNSTNGDGGALLANTPITSIHTLRNTIVAANAASSAAVSGCASEGVASVSSGGGNIETPGNTCNLSAGLGDKANTDPALGPLAANGGPTPTHALPPGSPAVDGGRPTNCSPPGSDQRGVTRPKGSECDVGAYEFDGLSVAATGCSSTGAIPVALTPPAFAKASGARFRVDGGPEQSAAAVGSPPGAFAAVPEGSHSLEYWGVFTSGQELAHHTASVLVDSTGPTVTLTSEQGRTGYTVGERATFRVTASDGGSGLGSDPTATRQQINTSRPGTVRVQRSAVDRCGNTTVSELAVTVLPLPVYGESVNLIPLKNPVLVDLPGRAARGNASASQKGQRFIPLQQARQVPVGTLVNTRRGRVRLVSRRDPRTRRTQAGEFFSGLFQVLQSRRRRARGLTELRLKGSSFRPCRSSARAKASARSAASRRTIRRLRANARGRFRTRGRHSAATVRGTVWTTTDRCDGTLTRVTRGSVAVRDFRRRKTIVVRRGKSYLARARR